jgi:hypothetical protein
MYKIDFENSNILKTMQVLETEKIKIDQMAPEERE